MVKKANITGTRRDRELFCVMLRGGGAIDGRHWDGFARGGGQVEGKSNDLAFAQVGQRVNRIF